MMNEMPVGGMSSQLLCIYSNNKLKKKGKPYSSHLREKTEEPEYEQSRANMITKPSKLCLTQRCEEKKNKKYKVKMLIRVIPESSSEDDTTYFLLKPFSDP